jgi:pimeloyl-ACP methyl ester carboxylesterase
MDFSKRGYSSSHFSYYVKRVDDADDMGINNNNTNKSTKTLTPLVFFHGIGGGLFCYLKVMYKILKLGGERPIFLVELPHVSMKLLAADMVVGMSDFVKEVEMMLHKHNYTKASFVGHSLGTIYCAWMVKYSKLVMGVVLIDPVCFKVKKQK